MSEVHHFILNELKLAIQRSVPIEPLLDGLVQHGVISCAEREILHGKKGMQRLLSKLRGRSFHTFTLFVKCILEAGEKDVSVNTCIVNSIRGAASSFDQVHRTMYTQEIPQKQYPAGFLESDEDEDHMSDDGCSSITSGYVSNATTSVFSTPKSSFDDDPDTEEPAYPESGQQLIEVSEHDATKDGDIASRIIEDVDRVPSLIPSQVVQNEEEHENDPGIKGLLHGFERFFLKDMEETGQVYGRGLYGRVIGVTANGKSCIAKEYNKVNAFITNCGFHSSFRHRNVIGFIGCHYQPMLLVVLEEMEMNFNKVMGLPNLSYSTKLSILHDISEGIHYLHNLSPAIVHCDISPRHVLFTKSLSAKISALNFCTVAGNSTSKPYVSPTQQLFNPPEINEAVTPKFDIYSFGMMCVYMLLGSERIQEKAYNNSVRFDLSSLDLELQNLIEKCLNFDMNARPTSKIVSQEMKKLSVQTPRRLNDILEAINPTTDIEVSLISKDYMQVEQLKHEDAYNEILSKGESLNMKFLKFFFLGLPRTGKTSMRKRITGKIDDIKTAPSQNPETQEPSTGAVEVPRRIILRKATTTSTAVVTSKFEWHFTDDLNDEACMLNKLFFEVSGSFHQSRRRGKRSPTLKTTVNLKLDSTNFSESGEQEVGGISASYSMKVSGRAPKLSRSSNKSSKKSKAPKAPQEKKFTFSSEIEELFTIFRDAMTTGKWDKVHFVLSGTILLYMIDTGGQSEFLEMLPALTLGPALSLIFFKLNEKLNSLYNVVYVHENGDTTLPYESEFTVEEMIFQLLSSIACFSSFGGSSTNKPSSERARLSDSLQSASILVGTHRDKVSEEAISEVDGYLQQKLRATDFFKRELVQFFKPDQGLMILPIDNMTGGRKEVISIRKFIEDLIDRYFSEIRVPAAWLIFSLCLRKLGKKIFHFDECAVIADKLYMDEEELKEALWFLHHSVGSIMHFSEIPELQGMVICDIQVIFDSVTRLIVNTYTFGNVHPAVEERFRKTGIFSLKEIRKAASSSSSLIPLKKLVVLLQHINFIALIQDDNNDQQECSGKFDSIESHRYFMPAILKSISRSKLLKEMNESSSCSHFLLPSPLMIHYECGYVPIGMFCALIANLVGRGHKYVPKWNLCEDKEVHKNKVSFNVGAEYDIVTLISHPTYYEIVISRPIFDFDPPISPKVATYVLCSQVLSTIKTSLKLVCSRMNYPFQVGYNLAFRCPDHPMEEHLCITDRDDLSPQVMQCRSPKNRRLVRLQPQHSVWFQAEFDTQAPKLKDLTLLKCQDYYNLGLQLDLPQHTLEVIKQDNHNDIRAFAREMFATWLHGQGSKPTYKNLVLALRKVGENEEVQRLCNRFGISTDAL